ncbi:MAG: hypothetical protein EOP53_21860 [Sphingobacteriales bacterium]|nr:MAG: hypothetical protein EOP53_21860 [Sphingobacteriales bacterium]
MIEEQTGELAEIITEIVNSGAAFSITNEEDFTSADAATHKVYMRGKDGGTEWRMSPTNDWPQFHKSMAKSMRDCDVKIGRWKFFGAINYVNELAELGPGESLRSDLRKLVRSFKRV